MFIAMDLPAAPAVTSNVGRRHSNEFSVEVGKEGRVEVCIVCLSCRMIG